VANQKLPRNGARQTVNPQTHHDSPLDCAPQVSGSGARYGFHSV
jgi:hypothetical protein